MWLGRTRVVAAVLACLVAVFSPLHVAASFVEFDYGLSSLDGATVGCLGDFNSDKHVDVVAYTHHKNSTEGAAQGYYSTVEVFLYRKGRYTPSGITATVPGRVISLVQGDFDRDGKLDILAFAAGGAAGAQAAEDQFPLLAPVLLRGSLDALTPIAVAGLDGLRAVPAVVDADNDLELDLFGEGPDGKRAVWLNVGLSADAQTFTFDSTPAATVAELVAGARGRIASHWGGGFVDIDGDCRADVVVVAAGGDGAEDSALFLEVYVNAVGSFRAPRRWPLPAGAGALSFADVDADGNVDIVFPVCLPAGSCTAKNELHVLYAVQRGMCSSLINPGRNCRGQQSLCAADDKYTFADATLPPGTGDGAAHHVVIPLPAGRRFAPHATTPGAAARALATGTAGGPLQVRVGDANNDGFPDLLLPLAGEADAKATVVELWRNVPCAHDRPECAPAATAKGRRTFTRIATDAPALASLTDVSAAAFLDITNHGAPDILVLQRSGGGGSSGGARAVSLKNAFEEDASFLALMGLNGVCPAWCKTGPEFPSPRPYGASMHGVSFKFTITSLAGRKSARAVPQLSQSAYGALQTPYVQSGLGRTANYIEELFAGFTIASATRYYNMWVAMIPNAQLVVFPYGRDPASWPIEMFVAPSQRLVAVVIAFVVTLAVLAVTIGVLHWREKQRDLADKQRRAATSSFFFRG